jgi:hypothetical protein
MVASVGDGIFCAKYNEGVMSGEPMAAFLPLQFTPLERLDGLLNCIRSWAGQDLLVLKPLDWFERGHGITGLALWGGGLSHDIREGKLPLETTSCGGRGSG